MRRSAPIAHWWTWAGGLASRKGVGVVYCQNCGRYNEDPGAPDLTGWTCGYCGSGALIRIQAPPPPTHPQAGTDPGRVVAGGALGAAIGAAFGGLPGAALGAVVGAFFGARR